MSAVSFALILGAIGTFVGTLGGLGRAAKWLIERSDRRRERASRAAQEPSGEVRRYADQVAWLEQRNKTLEQQLDDAERDNDRLRAKWREAVEQLDDYIGENRQLKQEREELRVQCNKYERESKRPPAES